MITVNHTIARKLIIRCLASHKVPLLRSSPGMGKSSLIHQIAHDGNFKVLDLRLAGCDPTDINGYPYLDPKTGAFTQVALDAFPLCDRPLPSRMVDGVQKPYSGWIILLDELTSASQAVQAAVYKPILDHMIGLRKIHPLAYIVGCGNLETDNAVVEPLSTALASRVIHINLHNDLDCFLNIAYERKFNQKIIAYITWKGLAGVTNFDPSNQADTYACARTWEFMSDLMIKDMPDEEFTPLAAGTIGEAMGLEFSSFCSIYLDLPSIPAILANPDTHFVPDRPDIQYALTSALSGAVKADNIGEIITYLSRLPAEIQMFTIRMMNMQHGTVFSSHPAFMPWVRKFSAYINGVV